MIALDDLLTAADAAMTAVHNLHGDLGPDQDAPWHKHEGAFRKLDAAIVAFDASRYLDLDAPETAERLMEALWDADTEWRFDKRRTAREFAVRLLAALRAKP